MQRLKRWLDCQWGMKRKIMALNLGKITVSVGPHDLGAADNLERIITSFIGGAKASLDVAVQELESEPITRALIAAKRRGVRQRRDGIA